MSERSTAGVVYVFVVGRWRNGDVLGVAAAADGTELAHHVSSDENWLRHDLGVASNRQHDAYLMHFPAGFEVRYAVHPDWVAGAEVRDTEVRALAINDGAEADIDLVPWLRQASADDILHLAVYEWGNSPASAPITAPIVDWLEQHDEASARVFHKTEFFCQDEQSYYLIVNVVEALAWLHAHRPEIDFLELAR